MAADRGDTLNPAQAAKRFAKCKKCIWFDRGFDSPEEDMCLGVGMTVISVDDTSCDEVYERSYAYDPSRVCGEEDDGYAD